MKDGSSEKMRQIPGGLNTQLPIETMGPDRTCLLILGMHRSGTSALTRVLNIAGADLPLRLMGAGEGNEIGHWEPQTLVTYHDQLFSAAQSSWYDWKKIDYAPLGPGRRDVVKSEIGQIVSDDYGDSRLFALKDPRICRIAPLVMEALDGMGVRIAPILMFRNPKDVVASLEARSRYWPEGYSKADASLLWLRHVLDAEIATRHMPRVLLTYERLLSDWRHQLRQIESKLNISFPYPLDEIGSSIDAFLSPWMRHHSHTAESVVLDPLLRGWVSDAYAALSLLVQAPESKKALSDLDGIRRAFDATSPNLSALLAAARDAERAVTDQRWTHESTQTAEHFAIIEQSSAAASLELEQLRATLNTTEASLNTRTAELKDAMANLLMAQDALDFETQKEREKSAALQEVLSNKNSELEHLKSDLQLKVGSTLADLAVARSDAERERERAAEFERALNVKASELGKVSDEMGAALAASHAKLEFAEKAVAEAQNRTKVIEATLDARISEMSKIHNRLQASLNKKLLQLSTTKQVVKDERIRIKALNEALDSRTAELEAALNQARELQSAMAARDARIAFIETALATQLTRTAELDAQVGAKTRAIAIARKEADRARTAIEQVDVAYRQSTSWRLTSPLRGVKKLLAGTKEIEASLQAKIYSDLLKVEDVPSDEIIYFTICSRNFMAYARTLYKSLERFYPGVRFFVALCDDSAAYEPFAPAREPFEFISLDDLELPEWREMSIRYNITEFNTSIKPFIFKYLFNKIGARNVVYFDPDIYVVDRLTELEEAFLDGATGILTPHMLEPAPTAEMNEKRLLQYGIYNLGFLGLRNTADTRRLVDWWGHRLKTDCVIKREEGLFVDQKWADHFPAFLPGMLILQHPGYNVAYWNLSSRKITWTGNRWDVNGQPLRFYHFSGNDLDNPDCVSRHSSEHTSHNVGHLSYLLEEYRRRIFEEGHAQYRMIPYAFSWEGASGVNEHTPRPKSQTLSQGSNRASPGEVNLPSRLAMMQMDDILKWRKKLLFIEWTTPRPNQDSGSRTAYYFIEILSILGYAVTFLPVDMQYAGHYSDSLEDLGVTCIHGGISNSVASYLAEVGAEFDIVVLNRVHVALAVLSDIQLHCRSAKLIFNTVDLHYLRELREAKIAGLGTDQAMATKQLELGIIAAADETIVLSHIEQRELRKELPKANVCVLPLVFSEIDASPPAYGERKDIIFIGGFPHPPNVDAVLTFAKDVFPKLRAKRPDIVWHIVGNAPPEEVLALAREPGINVHGFVDDLAPLFRSVRLSVAPLRYGAGIKGKIATSLSFGVPVVASRIAIEGMEIKDGEHVCVAQRPKEWVDTILSLYDDEPRWTRMSENGQALTVAQYSVPANTLRVGEMMERVDPDFKRIELFRFGSKREHDYLRKSFPALMGNRLAHELELLPDGEQAFNTGGFCATCGTNRKFLTSFMYSCENHSTGRPVPNWREHLACVECGFTMRLRAAMHLFFSRLYPGAEASLYITEQATPLFTWLKARHDNLTGSEYLGDACAFGQEIGGYRNEDLTRLTFPDSMFEAILSFDVLEHVPDDLAAFRECYRCLKPGGVLFFTAPFAYDKENKVIRAELQSDGTINHIMPPEIHGNPVDSNGALCFRYFGWDVLNDLKASGFTDVNVFNYWSSDYKYLGNFGYIVVARKEEANG